jgi:hypothetical protein
MRTLVASLLGLVTIVALAHAADKEPSKRDASKYKVSDVKVETDLTKLTATARPKKLSLAPSTSSSFDLADGGVMHLHFSQDSTAVEVWPLDYLGGAGDFHVCREVSGFKWLWVFTSDKVYFITPGGTVRVFEENAKLLDRIP